MQIIKAIIIAIVAFAALALFLNWTEARDQKVMQAAERYEKCVIETMHTTPMEYYHEHGEFPECQNDEITAEYR